MTDIEDRVKYFGKTDVNGLSSIEFKNIPTDFCQLKICGMFNTVTDNSAAGDFYFDVEFQNSAATSKVLGVEVRHGQANWTYKTCSHIGQAKASWLAGITGFGAGPSGNNANGQGSFEFMVMEPGSSRSKSLQIESEWTDNGAATWITCTKGQYRIDSQQAVSNAASKSVFDKIKITMRHQYSPTTTITWGNKSSIWLEGWGGGHT
jgi:hypothetical protein